MNNARGHQGIWASADAYEPYMGRWSRLVANDFLKWLSLPAGGYWLDVGCGTGVLSRAILEKCKPKEVTGIDLSQSYLEYACDHVVDKRAHFRLGDAQNMSGQIDHCYDAVISGLALNFMAEPDRAVREMVRVICPDGTVAAYVWDYAGGMQLLRYFWDAAVTLDPSVRALDEGQRSPICNPTALARLFRDSGLSHVQTSALDVVAHFQNYSDYWLPFLGGQGTVASYAISLSEERRNELRELIRVRLPMVADGSIHMTLRAWAVKGRLK